MNQKSQCVPQVFQPNEFARENDDRKDLLTTNLYAVNIFDAKLLALKSVFSDSNKGGENLCMFVGLVPACSISRAIRPFNKPPTLSSG